MSEFSEVQKTSSGRQYFGFYDERFGNNACIEIVNDVLEFKDLNGIEFKTRFAMFYKNGRIKYIRDFFESDVAKCIPIIEIFTDKDDPLTLAKIIAESRKAV